jgi:hypothetical protein
MALATRCVKMPKRARSLSLVRSATLKRMEERSRTSWLWQSILLIQRESEYFFPEGANEIKGADCRFQQNI